MDVPWLARYPAAISALGSWASLADTFHGNHGGHDELALWAVI